MTTGNKAESQGNGECASCRLTSGTIRYSVVCCAVLLMGVLFYFSEYSELIFNLKPALKESISSEQRFFVNEYSLLANETLKIYGQYQNEKEERGIILDGLSALVDQIKPSIIKDPKLLKLELPGLQYFDVSRQVSDVNCKKIFYGDESEMKLASNRSSTNPRKEVTAETYISMTKNCTDFKLKRGYILSSLTKLEAEFPIAFSLLMFKHVEQAERLFRAIYRPQNFYCFHVDKKSDKNVILAMELIASCFDNVVMTTRYVDVQWGTYSVLEPEILCMEQLWYMSKKWKYFINLTGQEYPLKTNYELVKILQAYKGANDIEGTVKRANKDRWSKAGPPPHNITVMKGSVHITVNRDFVDFILHNQIAKDLLEWMKNTSVPDESFFASLNHNSQLGIRGSYSGLPETDGVVKPFLTRFKNWGNFIYDWPCHGKRVRMICVFGTGDLPLMASRPELFANKFYFDYERYALDCMEELIFNKTKEEYLGQRSFDVRLYEQAGFVLNRI